MRAALLSFIALFLAACCLAEKPLATGSKNSLVWHEDQKAFDADISGLELHELLQKISGLTGWDVYLEPGVSYFASAKFKDLSRSEALRVLLGRMNFELSPQTNSQPKLFVFSTGAAKATELIRAEKNKIVLGKNKVIANHLIVSLKPGSKMNIYALAQQLGGKIIGKIDGVDSYLLEFPDAATANAAREQLSKSDSVASVDSNYQLERPAPFALASTDRSSRFALKAGANGDGKQIVVGLVDTAVQRLSADMQGFLLPAISVAGQANPGNDIPTHGTTMAESFLHGLASTSTQGEPSSVRILPVDIYGDNPTTDTFQIASGIVQAVNGGANIVSISSGGDGDSPFLERLVGEVADKGILIFAAAGNQPVATSTYPAAYPDVIAVTSAQDQKGTLAPYANYGSFVDVILPGATIVPFNGQNYFVNGTSVSTALASGMMAGLAATTGQSPSQLSAGFKKMTAFKK